MQWYRDRVILTKLEMTLNFLQHDRGHMWWYRDRVILTKLEMTLSSPRHGRGHIQENSSQNLTKLEMIKLFLTWQRVLAVVQRHGDTRQTGDDIELFTMRQKAHVVVQGQGNTHQTGDDIELFVT